MSEFVFFDNHHGDVGLKLNEEYYNFGYDYTLKFPLVNWLYSRQLNQGNIFSDYPISQNPRISLDEDISETIEQSSQLYRRLPLSASDLDLGLFNSRLLYINAAPNYHITYIWKLNEN